MKLILLLFLLCVTYPNCYSFESLHELGNELHEEWIAFKNKFNKFYNHEEDLLRKKIFAENIKFINEHNKKLYQSDKPKPTFRLGINKYSDLNDTEVATYLKGYRKTKKHTNIFVPPDNFTIPDKLDWRNTSCVTEVKDQGMCGSCWAFSSTGALESQLCLKESKKVNLSEQNLVDCSTSFGNEGCRGGEMDFSFKYIQKNNGIDSEESYPYEARDYKCRYKRKYSQGTDNGFKDISQSNEKELKIALALVGPISVALDASQRTFSAYSGGIYSDHNCNKKKLDHAMLLVGYGKDPDTNYNYWIIKNSWGPTWGEEGYMRILAGKNMCGIAEMASYPIVKKR